MKTGIFPCNGACNVGVMTGKVALSVVDNDKVNLVCALGLPLGIESIVSMAKSNDHFIALNGCPIRCASKALDVIGVEDYQELVLTTDFIIQKKKDLLDETNLSHIERRVKEMLEKADS